MSRIRQKISITDSEDTQIRRVWDEERQRWYFSIADVMAVLTESVDARNYWKALKNRLNKTQPQLVMDCNQLKMKASDGKSYMVDVADASTILKIIQVLAPFNVQVFKSWFDHIEVQNSLKTDYKASQTPDGDWLSGLDETKISTALEPAVDIYDNGGSIITSLMLPGIDPEKITVTTSMTNLIIKGVRIESVSSDEKKYLYKELPWGQFYKQITLPSLVDVDNVEVTELHGLIIIKLPKIDQNKTRFIKIRSL